MLSRVADHIYWLSRYIERAENIARFVDVNLHLMLDLRMDVRQQWEPMVTITGDREWFAAKYDGATQENVLQFLTFDTEYPHSVMSCLREARENARSIREVISSEMWEHVNRFYHFVSDGAARRMVVERPHDFYTELKMLSHMFIGLAEGTMSHGEGWHFSRLGRLLERADKTSRLIDVKYFILLPQIAYVGTTYDNAQWAAVLRSASALEMYRKRHRRISPVGVAEFLILDRVFPRSIYFCLSSAEESLHLITGTPPGTHCNAAERLLGRLLADLTYSSIQDIFDKGLHEYLDSFQARLNDVGGGIFESFFALRDVQPSAARRQERL